MALWLTTGDADTYFETRLGAEDYWATGTPKTAALTTAQNDIVNSGLYTFTDSDGNDLTEPGSETQLMKDAVCEQALFLLRDVAGIDGRAALQAQGVASAAIIGESFNKLISQRRPRDITLAPKVEAMLATYKTTGIDAGTGSFDVVR